MPSVGTVIGLGPRVFVRAVVLLAYNDEQVIGTSLVQFLNVLPEWVKDFEIIVRAFRELFFFAHKWRREERVRAQHILANEHHPFEKRANSGTAYFW